MNLLNRLSQRSPRNERTLKDLSKYLSQRYDLLKLELLEKSSQLISVTLSMLIVVVCALVVLIYLSNALVSWLTIALNAGWAYTIVCGLFILVIVVVFVTKDKLFVKPLIRKFSSILYKEKNDNVDEDVSVIADEKGGDRE